MSGHNPESDPIHIPNVDHIDDYGRDTDNIGIEAPKIPDNSALSVKLDSSPNKPHPVGQNSAEELNLIDELDEMDIGPLDRVNLHPSSNINSKTVSRSSSPHIALPSATNNSQDQIRRNSTLKPVVTEDSRSDGKDLEDSEEHDRSTNDNDKDDETSKISAYARLDFENFTFFVQTLQVVLGRKSNDDLLHSSSHAVDVHLSSKKAISRRHAKIFYNFGTQRFEISITGRNGAFVDDTFVEKGITMPLSDGTKIQIGDLPFKFVLPSVEPSEEDPLSVPPKQFNPTDAINLRSNLYSKKVPKKKIEKSNSPQEEKEKEIKEAPKKEEPQNKKEEGKESTSRRNSLLKIRRLSNARRKSLASAANDEINDILKELGVSSIDAIDEEDSEMLDSQIQAMLAEHQGNEPEEGLEENLLKLSQYNETAIEEEEDEIDRLVKQHNLEQGVNLDEDNDGNTHDIDMDLSILDHEIATLGPLIDVHNQGLMKEKEERRRKLEQERDLKKQQFQQKQNFRRIEDSQIDPSIGSAPLMGKPAVPRMGKAASIQPPANRLYNRGPTQKLDNRLVPIPGIGLPNMASGLGLDSSQLPMKLPQGLIYNGLKSVVPPRPPPPKLEVPVLAIISEPSAVRPRPPLRAITVTGKATLTTFGVPKTVEEPSKFPKIPRRRMPMTPAQSLKKLPKKVYTIDEIPEQYRTKPSIQLPVIITNALRAHRDDGLTLTELYESIKESYPYYKYCPDGWQFSVSHNVKLNKIFKRKTKRDREWVYIIDDLYINEREKVRRKQQELIAARAKAAEAKAEELRQKQRLEAQHSIMGRAYTSPYGLASPSSPFMSQLQYKGSPGMPNAAKPKTIAELASEIRRDPSKAPMYFKPSAASGAPDRASSGPVTPAPPANTIKAQLAANRSASPASSASSSTTGASPVGMNNDTKKSLAYLQKELFTLYKARKLSYNTATTTEIITKALATTIAQVNVIGAKAGCGDNALSFLVEKAPSQVSKILDIALTKSIKEKQGGSVPSSRTASRAGTPSSQSPAPTQASPAPAPAPTASVPSNSQDAPASAPTTQSSPQSPVLKKEPESPGKSAPAAPAPPAASAPLGPSTSPETKPAGPQLSKPPSFGSGLARPPSYKSNTSLSKPQSFAKPGGLSRPPSFLSNKPAQRPGFERPAKRDSDENDDNARKIIKTE